MRRWILVGLFAGGRMLAQDLPQHDPSDALDIEPPLLIKDGKPLVPIPDAPAAAQSTDELEVKLERARKGAATGERQVKAGIISRAQADERVVKVARLAAELAHSKLQATQQARDEMQQRSDRGEISPTQLKEAIDAVGAAEESARTANENRQRAEVEFARANLQRQQKLLALGSGRKADVQRAEAKLSELTQPSD